MILIGLGANLPGRFGSPEAALEAARTALPGKGIGVAAVSSLWLTAPVPPSDQPYYRNQVLRLETDLDPAEVLGRLQALEGELGRVRSVPNAARVIDLDLLCYGERVYNDPVLTLPHPRLHQRAFVLYPLQEIAPSWVHPVSGLSVAQMIAALDPVQEVRRVS